MSSLNKVVSLLQNQSFPIMEKTVEREIETKKILLQNGVRKDSGFLKLSTKYFLRLLDTR